MYIERGLAPEVDRRSLLLKLGVEFLLGRQHFLPSDSVLTHELLRGFGQVLTLLGDSDPEDVGIRDAGTLRANPQYVVPGNPQQFDGVTGKILIGENAYDYASTGYRGGGWGGDAAICRSAFRLGGAPTVRGFYLGFRLALSPSEPPAASK